MQCNRLWRSVRSHNSPGTAETACSTSLCLPCPCSVIVFALVRFLALGNATLGREDRSLLMDSRLPPRTFPCIGRRIGAGNRPAPVGLKVLPHQSFPGVGIQSSERLLYQSLREGLVALHLKITRTREERHIQEAADLFK